MGLISVTLSGQATAIGPAGCGLGAFTCPIGWRGASLHRAFRPRGCALRPGRRPGCRAGLGCLRLGSNAGTAGENSYQCASPATFALPCASSFLGQAETPFLLTKLNNVESRFARRLPARVRPMRASQNSGIRRKNSYGVKPDLQAAGLLVSAEAYKQPSTMRFGARRTPPPRAVVANGSPHRLHRPQRVRAEPNSQRSLSPLRVTGDA